MDHTTTLVLGVCHQIIQSKIHVTCKYAPYPIRLQCISINTKYNRPMCIISLLIRCPNINELLAWFYGYHIDPFQPPT